MRAILEKPFEQTLAEVQTRTATLNPVDRRSRLDLFEVQFPEGGQPLLRPLQHQGDMVLLTSIQIGPLALKQLFDKIRFPRQLSERLPGKLNWAVVNYLMQNERTERDALLRLTHGGTTARAILGSKYTPLDDLELLAVASDYLQGAVVRWEAFTDTTSHLTVTFPGTGPEGLERGLHIANSEVGLRAVTIEAVAWRKACNNILPALGFGGDDWFGVRNDQVVRRGTSQATVGQVKSSWRFIHSGDASRLRDFVRDAVADTSRQYEGLIARWQAGLRQAVEDPIGLIQQQAEERGHTADELKAALNAFAEGVPDFGTTVTGIANAWTAASQTVEDPERSYFTASTGTAALRMGLN